MIHQDRAQLVADVTGSEDERVVGAATELLAMGVHGDPAGLYLLKGGKAALRLRRVSEAAILLYHALRMVESGTPLWAEILVNRSIACAYYGDYLDAIQRGDEFLSNVGAVSPEQASEWVPKVHHALVLSYSRMGDHHLAAHHCRLAAEGYAVPAERSQALCDLACATTMDGDCAEGERVLAGVDQSTLSEFGRFVFQATRTVVLYYQRRYDDARTAGELAESLAQGNETVWGAPLLDLRLWKSRIAWELGERIVAGTLALHVAMRAELAFNVALRDRANEWLVTMMEQGGIRGA